MEDSNSSFKKAIAQHIFALTLKQLPANRWLSIIVDLISRVPKPVARGNILWDISANKIVVVDLRVRRPISMPLSLQYYVRQEEFIFKSLSQNTLALVLRVDRSQTDSVWSRRSSTSGIANAVLFNKIGQTIILYARHTPSRTT